MRNRTTVTTFILLGLSNDPQLQVVIFLLLFFTYLMSVTGNLFIITLTLPDSHLKTPMYFFLRNFSFLEISFTTVCIPKFLVSMATGDKTISYNCAAQLFFYYSLGCNRIFSSGCHVLWLLRGHLQTSALHDHHEWQSVQRTGLCLMVGWFHNTFSTTPCGSPAWFLCSQHCRSFRLWCISYITTLLHRHR